MSPQPMVRMSFHVLWRSHVNRNDGKKSRLQRICLYITPEMEGYPADENQAAAI